MDHGIYEPPESNMKYYINALRKKSQPVIRILFKERYKIIDKRKNHHASMVGYYY
ncbi:hypothetical protein BYT27DRAFT_7204985 [Phlegmacium glaucopus]|nr:hypothetical protein BYT27DRAFT_7204985 [Phlegmacium glaucopus]